MSAHLMEEAAKHIKNAEKKLKKSLTKWTISQSDHDLAALEYERAAKVYVHAKMFDKAIDTYMLCAEQFQQAGETGPFGEGRTYDAIANIHKDQKNIQKYADFSKRAGRCYMEDGKPDKYAQALLRGARALRETDPTAAAEMLTDALDTMGENDLFHLMPDPARTLAGIYVKQGDYMKAVAQIKQQIMMFKALKQQHNVHKAIMEIVVLHLARNDVILAEREHRQLASEHDLSGDENYACSDLIQGYEEGDPDVVKDVLSRQIWTFLTPEIARMTRKLTVSGVKKAKPAAPSPTAGAAPVAAVVSASPSPEAQAPPAPEPVVAEPEGDGDGDDLADWM